MRPHKNTQVNNYEKAKLDASTKAVTEKGTVRIEYPLPLQEQWQEISLQEACATRCA